MLSDSSVPMWTDKIISRDFFLLNKHSYSFHVLHTKMVIQIWAQTTGIVGLHSKYSTPLHNIGDGGDNMVKKSHKQTVLM